jgi:GT2 family glycosyltransferase
VQVSFVIPLYNNLALTRACVGSLQATLPHGFGHEIILVDDGSTDGTRDWLATLGPPFRVLLNPRNLGYAAANNRGATLATGEFLVLLNNDLILTPRWLEELLAAHRRLDRRTGPLGNVQLDARTGAVDHAGMWVDLQGKPRHWRSLPPRWSRALFPVRRTFAVTGACLLIERALWRELGGFDEKFINGGEDVDLCLRARARHRPSSVALRSIIRHHISASPGRKLHDEENSRRLALLWRNELARLAARRWCWHYLDREWTSPHPAIAHRAARQALLYALHLRRTPPPVALAGMQAAIEGEFRRWEKILPPPCS